MAKKMTDQERKYFEDTYQILKELLNSEVPLPSYYVLRLKGLTNGQFVQNYSCDQREGFTWEEIFMGFKLTNMINGSYIKNILQTKDLNHKFNYIMKLAQVNIVNVAEKIRLRNQMEDKSQKAIRDFKKDNTVQSDGTIRKAEYTRKSKEVKLGGLEDLW